MNINELLENVTEISISKKRSVINVIKNLKYINMTTMQMKVKQIYAYEVFIPLMYTYYKNLNIFAEVVPGKKGNYRFYFAEIGREITPIAKERGMISIDGMTLETFFDNFKELSKYEIDDFIEGYRKINRESGIIGDVRNIEPGIYPK